MCFAKFRIRSLDRGLPWSPLAGGLPWSPVAWPPVASRGLPWSPLAGVCIAKFRIRSLVVVSRGLPWSPLAWSPVVSLGVVSLGGMCVANSQIRSLSLVSQVWSPKFGLPHQRCLGSSAAEGVILFMNVIVVIAVVINKVYIINNY